MTTKAPGTPDRGVVTEDTLISLQSAATDSTGDPVLALPLSSATGWLYNLVMTVGPRADGIILSSRRRLLRYLRARDADGAAREMEHHLRGLHYMGRLAGGARLSVFS